MKTRYIADDSDAIAARLKEIEAERAAALSIPIQEDVAPGHDAGVCQDYVG